MLRKCAARLKGRAGFTLSEILIAVLILVMVSAVVVEGIPVALNAYHRVVNSSNAQMLLSTTMTKLRTELSTATEVKPVEGTSVTFTTGEGTRSKIYLSTTGASQGVRISEGIKADGTSEYDHLLVSEQAANRGQSAGGSKLNYLYVTYSALTYTDGIVTFTNLEVTDGTKSYATIETYQIRVLSDTAS